MGDIIGTRLKDAWDLNRQIELWVRGFEEQGRLRLRSGSMSNPVRLEHQLCGDRGNGEGMEGARKR